MKAIIVSDTHGRLMNLYEVLRKERDADMLIHCGDSCVELKNIRDMFDGEIYIVCGNCDCYSGLPRVEEFMFGRNRVFMAHGDAYGVGISTNNIFYAGQERGANVILYGHTHLPLCDFNGDTWICNPGSLEEPRQPGRKPTYAIMTLDEFGKPYIAMQEL